MVYDNGGDCERGRKRLNRNEEKEISVKFEGLMIL